MIFSPHVFVSWDWPFRDSIEESSSVPRCRRLDPRPDANSSSAQTSTGGKPGRPTRPERIDAMVGFDCRRHGVLLKSREPDAIFRLPPHGAIAKYPIKLNLLLARHERQGDQSQTTDGAETRRCRRARIVLRARLHAAIRLRRSAKQQVKLVALPATRLSPVDQALKPALPGFFLGRLPVRRCRAGATPT
jgi:hypothetical protein